MSDPAAADPVDRAVANPAVDPEIDPEVGEWERHLCAPITGRRVIAAFELLAGMTSTVERLRRWGAQRPLLLPEGVGTGPLPGPDEATVVHLPATDYPTMTEQVRHRLHPDDVLTAEARAAVEAYDPEASALWWVSPVGPNVDILGRRVLGGRPLRQIALEDKAVVDELLGAVGADMSPVQLAQATYDDLMAATDRVRRAAGVDQVVWAGDASGGINGGGDYVRWVRTEDQAAKFAEFFAGRCERVRVSPFLEGVPCSIHGLVLPDGVVVFRPVEIASLRDPARGTFVYAGLGTTWEPGPDDTAQMRAMARSLGSHLSGAHGFVGAFGLDGVLAAEGFRVTELNPRLSGGLTRMGRAAPELHLELVQVNALLGRDIAMSAGEYEELALRLLDESRFVDVIAVVPGLETETSIELAVTAGESHLERAMPEDEVVGTVVRGPSPMGSFLRLTTVDGAIGLGDRVAPLGVLLHQFANREWDAGLGELIMSGEVEQGR